MLQEKERRAASNQARHYIPNGKAEEFIKLVGEGKNFISMFIAANGVGKTAAGVNIIANICYGIQNDFFNYPLFKNFPYLKRGRIISDPTTLKEKIIPELKKWFPGSDAERLPEANFETAKEGKNYEAKFVTNTGWQIDLMSNEQDAKEFESVDLGFAWFDEPAPEAIFKATVSRGRMGMIMIWTMTPLSYSAWIKDQLIDMANDKGVGWVEAEIEDNCIDHGERGILEHENILKMIAAYDEDELESRAFGKFGHLVGRVHKAFSRKIHVIKSFPVDMRKFSVYHALDPHPREPDHAMWLAVNKYGTKYIVNELVTKGLISDLSIRIQDIEQVGNYRIERRIIDPSAYNDDQHNEKPSVGSRLSDLGLNYIKGSKDLQAGIKRTNDALDYETKGTLFVREPELFVFDTCPIAIKQLEEYTWQEHKGKSKDEKQAKGKPRDKNDHQCENLHRLLLTEPEFVPYQPQGSGMPFNQMGWEQSLDPYW